MMGLVRRLHEDEQGQAMVEFVLVFPIQLLLSLCILQFAYLAHAQIVVGHAAFMGARAAAVADNNLMEGMSPQDAATREAARILAQLTSGDPSGGSPPPANGEMKWDSGGGGIRVRAPHQAEAYSLLEPVIVRPHEDYVACDVTFNYVMTIPVANHLFARFGGGGDEFFFGTPGAYNAAAQRYGRTIIQVRRVGFISTPWTQPVGGER
jgi:Flp pilus assembly protein TadG